MFSINWNSKSEKKRTLKSWLAILKNNNKIRKQQLRRRKEERSINRNSVVAEVVVELK